MANIAYVRVSTVEQNESRQLEALEKYGAAKGGWLALKRLCRCHPFHRGEHDFYDPVP